MKNSYRVYLNIEQGSSQHDEARISTLNFNEAKKEFIEICEAIKEGRYSNDQGPEISEDDRSKIYPYFTPEEYRQYVKVMVYFERWEVDDADENYNDDCFIDFENDEYEQLGYKEFICYYG